MADAAKHVLVVDDEPVIGSTIRSILESAGHKVTCILDGNAALARIQGESFDIVITDMFMPEVDGPQLIRAVRQLHKGTGIIAISGGGAYLHAGEAVTIAKGLGANAVLEKPFTPTELLDCVNETLRSTDRR